MPAASVLPVIASIALLAAPLHQPAAALPFSSCLSVVLFSAALLPASAQLHPPCPWLLRSHRASWRCDLLTLLVLMLPDARARGCWSHPRAGHQRRNSARFQLALCASRTAAPLSSVCSCPCRAIGVEAVLMRIPAKPQLARSCSSLPQPAARNCCWNWTDGSTGTALAVRITAQLNSRC